MVAGSRAEDGGGRMRGRNVLLRGELRLYHQQHSYDQRVVDGALGGMLVRRVADYLEKFDISRTI